MRGSTPLRGTYALQRKKLKAIPLRDGFLNGMTACYRKYITAWGCSLSFDLFEFEIPCILVTYFKSNYFVTAYPEYVKPLFIGIQSLKYRKNFFLRHFLFYFFSDAISITKR